VIRLSQWFITLCLWLYCICADIYCLFIFLAVWKS